MKKAKSIIRGYKNGARWDMLSNERVLNCIDKLLKGEVISQVVNNCSISRLANIIAEIRKVIGFSSIENYHLNIGKNQGYKLVNDDEVKQQLISLKDEINAKIEAKKPLKAANKTSSEIISERLTNETSKRYSKPKK